jgi:hypothetical protein
MTTERFARLCHWCIWPTVAVVLGCFAFWLFVVHDDSPQLSFGQAFLTLDGDVPADVIHLDDRPKFRLNGVVWLRDCDTSLGEQFIKVGEHARIDVGIHTIAYPGKLGPVVDKARWIIAPDTKMRDLSFGLTGRATFWMVAVSTCWGRKIATPTPPYVFDILP